MSAVSTGAPVASKRSRIEFGRYLRRNPSLVIGVSMVGALLGAGIHD